ncbi:translation initiation factor IF-2-like [Schistocerca gregaria]|uniref:translation initiation factor IF-2-like n=1 Tax=Schistocerca gregaria TaxID=7010 RepID=UPI00211DC2DF|nr:translation initiation factor IF-2-like [Schistocerca gregaria]
MTAGELAPAAASAGPSTAAAAAATPASSSADVQPAPLPPAPAPAPSSSFHLPPAPPHGDPHIAVGGSGGTWLCCLPCGWLRRSRPVRRAALSAATLAVTSLLVASPVLFLSAAAPTSTHRHDCSMAGLEKPPRLNGQPPKRAGVERV